jgi:hypothetical protein
LSRASTYIRCSISGFLLTSSSTAVLEVH